MRDRHYWQITSKPWCYLGMVIVAIAVIYCLILGRIAPAQAQSVEELKNYQNFVDQQRQIIQKQQEQINALTKPAQSRLDALRKKCAGY